MVTANRYIFKKSWKFSVWISETNGKKFQINKTNKKILRPFKFLFFLSGN